MKSCATCRHGVPTVARCRKMIRCFLPDRGWPLCQCDGCCARWVADIDITVDVREQSRALDAKGGRII